MSNPQQGVGTAWAAAPASPAEALPPAATQPSQAATGPSNIGTSGHPNPKLTKALENLKKSLYNEQRAQFSNCSKQDVEAAIIDIQNKLGAQRRLPNLQRLSKFLDFVAQLGIATGDSLSINGQSGFLWAPLRHALEETTRRPGRYDYLDKLVDIVADISEILPELQEYNSIFSRHPQVLKILGDYRDTIFTFHAGLMEVFNKGAWRAMFDSSWKRFSVVVKETKSTLERNRRRLQEAKSQATMQEVVGLTKLMSEKLDDLTLSNTPRDQLDSKERRRTQLCEVNRKLEPALFEDDQSRIIDRMHASAKGDWLLEDSRFVDWANLDNDVHKLLNLDGCPGAGKTFLVSAVIKHLQRSQTNPEAQGRTHSLAYFYFKHNTEDKTTFRHALQALVAQLVTDEDDGTLLDRIFGVLSRVHKPSMDQLKDLASTAIQAKRRCFVVLDGLDECKDEDEQAELVGWLKKQIPDVGEAPFTLRVLLSGRREGRLDKEITSFPSVLSISIDHLSSHHTGIRRYVEVEAEKIQINMGKIDNIRKEIVAKITSKAGGMFLFAVVTMKYLSEIFSVQELIEELKAGVFPDGLEQAYERAAQKVFKAGVSRASQQRVVQARRLLTWLSCVVRPLYWREVQALFIINPEVGPEHQAYLNMSELSPKKLCGCFVDVTVTNNESNMIVHVVHRTASEYLQHNGHNYIPPPAQQHADMLTFCCQYLKSMAFSAPVTQDQRRDYAKSGYYAFQDYAAAHWHDHAVLLRSSPSVMRPPEPSMRPALEALSSFLDVSFRDSGDTKSLCGLEPEWSLLDKVANLTPEASQRNKLFLVELWVSLARKAIDALRQDPTVVHDADLLQTLQSLYGPSSLKKCPRPWCRQFHRGFETQIDLQRHIDAHDRPFRCPFLDNEMCPVSSLGFESEAALARHIHRFHQTEPDLLFPNPPRSSIEPRKELSLAIKEGRLERVKELVTPENLSTVFNDNYGRNNPLIKAIRSGQFHVCKYLLESGAKVRDPRGKNLHITPLREAIMARDKEVFDLLLAQDGVDPVEAESVWPFESKIVLRDRYLRARVRYDTLGFAMASAPQDFVVALLSKVDLALNRDKHLGYYRAVCASRAAGRWRILELLRRKILPVPDLHQQDEHGRDLLSLASGANQPEILSWLLVNGPWDINTRCKEGRTPLSYAAEAGNLTSLRLILAVEGVDPVAKCNEERAPIWYATVNGHPESLTALITAYPSALDEVDGNGNTLYHHAAEKGHILCLKRLFDAGHSGIDRVNSRGKTPLFSAVRKAHFDCVQWLLDLPVGLVNPVHINEVGENVIHAAVSAMSTTEPTKEMSSEMFRIIRLLLEKMPASFDFPDDDGWCPSHRFAGVMRKQLWHTRHWECIIPLFVQTFDLNRPTADAKFGRSNECTLLDIWFESFPTVHRSQASFKFPEAILASGKFDFSALNQTRRKAMLERWRRALSYKSDEQSTILLMVNMIQRGFRPRLTDVWEVYPKLAPHLLVAIDDSLTIEYMVEPECAEILELACTSNELETEREAFLKARHPRLVAAIHKAIEPDGPTPLESETFPSVLGDGSTAERDAVPEALLINDPRSQVPSELPTPLIAAAPDDDRPTQEASDWTWEELELIDTYLNADRGTES